MTRPCMCPPGSHPPKDSATTYPGFVWSSLLKHIESEDRETAENEETNE